MTVPTYGPGYWFARRLIEVIRADSTMQGLLFPTWQKPMINERDTRVYSAHPDQDDRELLTILPRIIVETMTLPDSFEQNDEAMSVPVIVMFHSIVPKDQYPHVEAMDARIRTIIGSTNLSSNDIIASGLYEIDNRKRIVETNFYNAWRIVSTFKAENVGVLAA